MGYGRDAWAACRIVSGVRSGGIISTRIVHSFHPCVGPDASVLSRSDSYTRENDVGDELEREIVVSVVKEMLEVGEFDGVLCEGSPVQDEHDGELRADIVPFRLTLASLLESQGIFCANTRHRRVCREDRREKELSRCACPWSLPNRVTGGNEVQ